MIKDQKGIIHFFVLIILVVGLIGGLYLVQKQTQVKPEAFFDTPFRIRYFVKPYIIVAKQFDNDEKRQQIDQYKQIILQTLFLIQDWFKEKLSGHTFEYEPIIEVVYLDEELDFAQALGFTLPFSFQFSKKFEEELFPAEDGIIKAIWVIGSINGTPSGGPDGFGPDNLKNSGKVLIPESDIELYTGEKAEYSKNNSLGTLAQELAHAFGVYGDYGGWSQSHTCTVITPQNCKKNTPLPLVKYSFKMCIVIV